MRNFWIQLCINAAAGFAVTGLAMVAHGLPAAKVGKVFLILALVLLALVITTRTKRIGGAG